MKRFRNYLWVALGIVAAVWALTLTGSLRGYAGPPTFNVNVSNTPLPVSVDNWSTDPLPVRDADEAVKQPFQKEFIFSLPPNELYGMKDFPVPSGFRLVIEFASGHTQSMDPVQVPLLYFYTQTSTNYLTKARHVLALSPTGTDENGEIHHQGSTPMRVYAGADTTVSVYFSRGFLSSTGYAEGVFTLSGYLVPDSP